MGGGKGSGVYMGELNTPKPFMVSRLMGLGALVCAAGQVSCGPGSGVSVVPTGELEQRVVVPVSRKGAPDLEVKAY
jgi:hypothetical protein